MKTKLIPGRLASMAEGDYLDELLPNLMFRVGKNRRTWAVRCVIGGSRKTIRLGHFPQLGLAAARQAAAEAGRRVDAGLAPAGALVHPKSPAALSLGRLLDQYEKYRMAEGDKVKALPATLKSLRYTLGRDLLDAPAAAIRKADVMAVCDRLRAERKLAMVNLTLRGLSGAMRWAVRRDLIETNVCRDVDPAPKKKRDRVLSMDELAAIWRASFERGDGSRRAEDDPGGRLIRFLLLTGCRRSEAAGMRFGDVLDHVWKQGDNKSNRPTKVPLSALARAQLGEGKANDLCFQAQAGGFTNFHGRKMAIQQASGISGWTLHDLRRSLATHLGEAGVNDFVIRAILNHAVSGPLSAYFHAELMGDKRAALQSWSDRIAALVSDRGQAQDATNRGQQVAARGPRPARAAKAQAIPRGQAEV